MLNAPIQASVNTECLINQETKRSKSQRDYSRLLYLFHKQERTKRKDQSWRRLATLNKIAQKSGYNLPTYQEKRTIAELLNQYGEFSYLTGKHLGNYYLSTLDFDLRKEEFPEKLLQRLEKNTACLLDYLHVSYDQTKKGLHIDILTPEPLPNEQIYWIDKLGKTWNIGSIQSLGKYIVGEDPDKSFINNGKWYWKTKNNEEIKITLNLFFFRLGNQEIEKSVKITSDHPPNTSFNLEPQPLNLNPPAPKYFIIQAKILSKWKTKLENIWKVYYLNHQGNRGYFLWNHYQRKHFNLDLGTSGSILLIKGQRHHFFSRLL